MFSDNIASQLNKQDYTPKPTIKGVKFFDAKEFVDDGGSFVPLGRFFKGFLEIIPDFELHQINISQILHGVIKATHIHKNQEDIWFVSSADRLLVGLKDIRKSSATEGVLMRFVIGAGKSQILLIPRGVAHGCANPWQKPATLIYLVNQYFSLDPKTCDEFRLDPYFFGKDFWQITPG